MEDRNKTKEQLIAELAELRTRLAVDKSRRDGDEANGHLQPGDPRWHSLVANSPAFILILDREHRIQFVNHTNPGVLASDICGRRMEDFMTPECRDSVGECLEQVFATGKPGVCEGFAGRRGDEPEYYEASIGPVCENGVVTAVSVVAVNATACKRAELALHASEERFRLLVEAIPQPIWRSDPDGNVMEFNRRWYEYTGQTAEEAKGSGWTKALHPDEAAMVVDKVRAGITSGTPIEIVNRLRRASDGSYRWHLARAVPMNDRGGKTIGWFGCATDIDDQKQAEEAHRSSEAKYRRLHQSMRDAFASVDMDGHIQEYNEAFQKMLGYAPEELATLSYIDVTPEKWHSFESEILQTQVLARGYSDIYEKEYRRKDGTVFPVELRTFLLTDDDAQPRAMWAIVRDITERKRAEEALQKAHDELERKVQERTAELTEANEELAVFKRFVEAAGEGFAMADLNHRVTYANPAMLGLMGLHSLDQAAGQNLMSLHPQSVQGIIGEAVIPTLLHGEHWKGEIPIPSKAGEKREGLAHAFLVRNENGEPSHYGVVVTTSTKDSREAKGREHLLCRPCEQLRRLLGPTLRDWLFGVTSPNARQPRKHCGRATMSFKPSTMGCETGCCSLMLKRRSSFGAMPAIQRMLSCLRRMN